MGCGMSTTPHRARSDASTRADARRTAVHLYASSSAGRRSGSPTSPTPHGGSPTTNTWSMDNLTDPGDARKEYVRRNESKFKVTSPLHRAAALARLNGSFSSRSSRISDSNTTLTLPPSVSPSAPPQMRLPQLPTSPTLEGRDLITSPGGLTASPMERYLQLPGSVCVDDRSTNNDDEQSLSGDRTAESMPIDAGDFLLSPKSESSVVFLLPTDSKHICSDTHSDSLARRKSGTARARRTEAHHPIGFQRHLRTMAAADLDAWVNSMVMTSPSPSSSDIGLQPPAHDGDGGGDENDFQSPGATPSTMMLPVHRDDEA